MMYEYEILVNGQKRTKREWFEVPLTVGHTYIGLTGKDHGKSFKVIRKVGEAER